MSDAANDRSLAGQVAGLRSDLRAWQETGELRLKTLEYVAKKHSDLLHGTDAGPGLKTRLTLLEASRKRVLAAFSALWAIVAAVVCGLVSRSWNN